eukprot:gene2318-2626_t
MHSLGNKARKLPNASVMAQKRRFKRKGAEEGCSVIDYCLVSHEFLPSISRFEV